MTDTSPSSPTSRRGITFFDPPADAPLLQDTDLMSFPEVDPAVADQFMEWGLSAGHLSKVLYRSDDMSLVWAWFGPDHILPRHSHSSDCLYFVVSGEARLGNRTVPAGAGFFVPADAPYAYTAGPEGIQILEFRGANAFDMQITESPDRWNRIVETVRTQQETWQTESAPMR